MKSTFEGSGHGAGGNSTNGEILIVPVKRNSDSKEMYLALQSLPTGGGRSNVGIFYKELTDMTDINTVDNFAIDWNGFFEVTTKSSAYSSMDLQADDRIGFIYEETLTFFKKVSNPVSTCFPNGEGQHNYDGFDNIYVAYPLEYITGGAYSIKRDVNRRTYLQTYFAALTADASDEVKTAMATALDALSAEPTVAEVDALYRLLTDQDDEEGGEETALPFVPSTEEGQVWYYIRYKEQNRNNPTLPNGSWGYLADNFRFTATQSEGDDQLWQFIVTGDNAFHVVSYSGKYIVPGTMAEATTAPEKTWSVAESDTDGMYVLYNDATASQMHANKDTRLINWGYNTNGNGPRKNDAGCLFEFVEAKRTGTGINHSAFSNHNPGMIYDLQGRRVLNPTKGVHIVNGKKVIVK